MHALARILYLPNTLFLSVIFSPPQVHGDKHELQSASTAVECVGWVLKNGTAATAFNRCIYRKNQKFERFYANPRRWLFLFYLFYFLSCFFLEFFVLVAGLWTRTSLCSVLCVTTTVLRASRAFSSLLYKLGLKLSAVEGAALVV